MSKQPFSYKESLPLSVRYQGLQASSMGQLFYTHGNPTPEFMRDNTLKKDIHTQANSIHQGMLHIKIKGTWNFTAAFSAKKTKEEKSSTLFPHKLLILPFFVWWNQGSKNILRKKTHRGPKKHRTST